jgi:hypothetical protein
MSDINTQIVREFFELKRFHVMTHWQHEEQRRTAESGSLLFVENPGAVEAGNVPFLVAPGLVPRLHRAVVEVRAWHGDRFYPSVIESSPVLGHVAEDETRALAKSVFGSNEFQTVLVISELPGSEEQSERSRELLSEYGIDHIIEFSALLEEMLICISAHGHYAPSQTLQSMRLLKRYNLIRRQQLEFTFPGDVPEPPGNAAETTVPPEENAED